METEDPISLSLPSTVNGLHAGWQVLEKPSADTIWDFMWHGASEEGREKQLIQHPFLLRATKLPTTRAHASERVYIGEGALKMTLSTPNEVYDADHASRVLASVGEAEVKQAMQEMLDQGVASKVVRDPKKARPGRLLKISEAYVLPLTKEPGLLTFPIFQ